jgi:DNA-binding HxlR family transcriptional regulator
MAKIRHSTFDCIPGCSVEAAISLFEGKWKAVVLFHLMNADKLRFGELRRILPGVSPRVLTNQLRELEADGLIKRVVYAEVPPRVEYSLSALGATLRPIILALKDWGDENLTRFGKPVSTDGDAAIAS